MNDELKAKYNRIANDPSQLEMFKNDQIDALSTLQQTVEGKIGFDGQVRVTYHGGPLSYYYIPAEDLEFVYSSTTKRVVKTANSIGVLLETGNAYTLYELSIAVDVPCVYIYTIPLNATEETHIAEPTRKMFGTKLYMHAIDPFRSGGGGFVISTRSTRYTSMSDVVSDFRGDETHTTRILSARYGYAGGTETVVNMAWVSGGIAVYYLNGTTITSATIPSSSAISADYAIVPL